MRRVRLKHVADITAGQSPESAEVTHTADGLPFLQGCAEFGTKFPMTEKYCLNPPKTARKGSWLISVRAPVGTLNLADQDYCIGRGLAGVHPNGVHQGYLGYVLLDQGRFLNRISTGSTFQAISTFQLVNLEIVLPPLDTQRRIARLLDEKTARIDDLIAKKRELLDRLAEKRQALIIHAITNGLNPDGFIYPTDMGAFRGDRRAVEGARRINLLAETPENWTKASVRYFCDVQLGKMLQNDPSSERDELKPYLRAINVGKEGLDLSHRFNMWIRPQEADCFRLTKGDILVSEGGDAGRTVVFDADGEYYFQNALNRVRPNHYGRIEPEFIYYWFTFLKITGYVEMICNVATIPHFTAEKVKAAPLALPPLDTQRQIVRFLYKETARIDRLIVSIEKSIVHLEEYRAAQVTAAVTGQITELS